jgi:hypothetical protein
VTLDLDNIPAGELMDVVAGVRGLGYVYCMYSTRKHCEERPRLRVIFPLDRECTAVEYEPLARKIGEFIGINYCDPTTFQAARLMYMPSVCSDGQYFFGSGELDGWLPVDKVLAMYNDWNDVSEWAVPMGSPAVVVRSVDNRQADPREKKNIIGAWTRVYDTRDVMDSLLAEVYVSSDNGRYTFISGSTQNGVQFLDDYVFINSHHSTDPASGTIRNSFDLARIHLFGHLDATAKKDTPNNRLPSYLAMKAFAEGDSAVMEELRAIRNEELLADFGEEFSEEDMAPFLEGIPRNSEGKILKDSRTVLYFLDNDPRLKGVIAYDEFANKCVVLRCPPWQTAKFIEREFDDSDEAGLNVYLLGHKFKDRQSVKEALSLYWLNSKHNPLQDYLDRVVWDGGSRAESLFIDYFGALDNRYVRKATRMWLIGCVARAFSPGCKFDLMVILIGSQGAGKSNFIYDLSNGWCVEDMKSFKGTKPVENIQGSWLIEVSEMSAMREATVEEAKNFISIRGDTIRFPYARRSGTKPRMCAFIGTSNLPMILRDITGNRRYLPIQTEEQPTTKDFTKVKEEIDQIWAEVVCWYRAGEKAYYDKNDPDFQIITDMQEEHREESVYEPIVKEFISRKVPRDWNTKELHDRRNFWMGGNPLPESDLVERDRICALEIWLEAMGGEVNRLDQRTIREINNIIGSLKGWKKQAIRVKYLGIIKGYVKT